MDSPIQGLFTGSFGWDPRYLGSLCFLLNRSKRASIEIPTGRVSLPEKGVPEHFESQVGQKSRLPYPK